MLRIVHCFRSPVGGIFRHVRDLAAAQAAAGHQVGIVCDSSTGGAFEERYFDEVEPLLALGAARTPMQRHVGPGDIASAWRTFRLVQKLQPDVIHGHGAKGGFYARVFGSLLRVSRSCVARLYSPHGGSLHYDEATATGKTLFWLERLMARHTDHILFVSDYERDAWRRKVGEPGAPYSVVRNGMSAAEFIPVPSSPGAADFLYIGMMRDLKGPDLFIDAIAAVERLAGREVSAIMAGSGAGLPRYRARAETLGLANRVRFIEPIPARQAFAMARMVVVPSRAEAMPYVVLEALAAGKPVVATAVGGIPEIFGEAAPVLVPPQALRIAERMHEALLAPEAFARRMPPIHVLRARFGAETMATEVERAYKAALAC